MDRVELMENVVIPSMPEGGELVPLVYGGRELVLKTLNDSVDLISARFLGAGDHLIRAHMVLTEVVANDSVQAIVTLYENRGTPEALGTMTVADADAVGDIRHRAAIADGAAIPVLLGGFKIFAKVTTAGEDSGAETGKAKIYIELIKA